MTTARDPQTHEAGTSVGRDTADPAEQARVIGVAIAIPDPYGSHLREQRASFGDPEAHRIPPHITLLPPTEVVPDRLADVEEHLAAVAARFAPFTVHLRGTASFRPVSPVVFVQLAAGIAECERLESAVRSGPLQRDLAFYYHPHVTVAHHLKDDALDTAARALEAFDCTFEVTEFLAYEFGDDGVWRPQQAFGFPSAARGTSADRVGSVGDDVVDSGRTPVGER